MRSLKEILIFLFINKCFCTQLKIIELDHDLGPDTPYSEDSNVVSFTHEFVEEGYINGSWSALGKYSAHEHMGTHIDSPYTNNEHGLKVNEIPVDQFFAEAAVIDVTNKVASHDNYEVSVQDVKDWVNTNGVFSNNSIVLFYTGWDKGRYPDPKKYFGDKMIRHPGVTLEALKEVLSYQTSHGINIIAFGIDTTKLDRGLSTVYTTSTHVSNLNKYVVVNLRNLESLPPRGARLMIAPLKLRGASGAQTRVFARLPYPSD